MITAAKTARATFVALVAALLVGGAGSVPFASADALTVTASAPSQSSPITPDSQDWS